MPNSPRQLEINPSLIQTSEILKEQKDRYNQLLKDLDDSFHENDDLELEDQ